ncbi:GNAT family N-acetyltransferase [Streptomyces justiciae]|uniref:Lysine N-acyltransferase MbtK n=1 Tax=Streptomyces justiciae TaxID=2780140 RepID=A0ABU3LR97_9ACTN|nr:GNAT family N-acetyltransferase [Streptomyces justiciae]MDT7841735.1 GNAT family N-acetyltransferase [Streptomyces justiciae]
MPSTDASAKATTAHAPTADSGTGAGADLGPVEAPGTDCEDTLDLRLPDEFLALIAEEAADAGAAPSGAESRAQFGAGGPDRDDLLDGVADWGPVTTPVGVFHLVPVHAERDLPLLGRWMNDPTVAEFWELAGPQNRTEDHVRSQLSGDGRSVPCLGMLDGTPMSYWEIYRADLDPVARHYPARPHDTGIHLLIGAATDRGRGLGSALLRAVADLALNKRAACARVIAEPDLRNTPSVSAFLSAGFRFSAEIDLPEKRAALMVRDRSLREVL